MENNMRSYVSERKLLIACLLLSLLIFVVDCTIPVGVAGGVPYLLVILISLYSHGNRLPLMMAVLASTLTILGFFLSPPMAVLWQVLVNRSLALFAIWTATILGIQRQSMFAEKEHALEEIKVLRGFLAICASCKKIKDKAGGWRQMEAYIMEHSEAEFSHGICPDCAQKLYPELDLPADIKTPGDGTKG